MKNKQAVLPIAGILTLLAIGAAGLYLERPRTEMEIIVQSQPDIAQQTVTEKNVTGTTAVRKTKTSEQTVFVTETETGTASTETSLPERNLNQADAVDLKRVSGIGDALAEAIIAERMRLGGFTSRMQLCEISGIGEELMLRIMEEFEIPNETEPPEQIYAEPEQPDVTESTPEETVYYAGVYDANTVNKAELLTIPEMTEEKADSLLKLRDHLKGFHGIYELSLAEGISGDYFENVLKQYLYIEGDPYSIAGQEKN